MRYIYILLVSLCAMSCNDCDEDPVYRTAAGKLVYDYTEQSMESYIELMNMVQNIDEYINAPTQEEKYKVEDLLFRTCKIRELNGVCTVGSLPDNGTFRVETGGRKLNEPGSRWSVSGTFRQSSWIPKDGCTISYKSPNTWELILDGARYADFSNTATLTVEITTKRPQSVIPGSDYSLSGKGALLNTTMAKFMQIDYVIIEPMIYISNSETLSESYGDRYYPFVEGKMDMSVTNTTHSTPELVQSDLTGLRTRSSDVVITFKGNTETWNRYR